MGFRSSNCRWCQYGYASGTSLAASSFAICSLVNSQPDRAKVLLQLLFVPCTDDESRDRRPAQQPVQRNLRHRLTRLLRDLIDGIDDLVQILLRHLRPVSLPPWYCRRLSFGIPVDPAGSCRSGVPIPAATTPAPPLPGPARAASTPTHSRVRPASSTPGAPHTATTHSARSHSATSSDATRKNSSTRYTAPCPRAPGRRAPAASPLPARSRRTPCRW